LKDTKEWDLLFNYLGQTDNAFKEKGLLKLSAEQIGYDRSEELIVPEKLTVIAMVQQGELLVNWSYSPLHFSEQTVNDLANTFLNNLRELTTHCLCIISVKTSIHAFRF
jgi:non-ribosomal peptide synthase protein (TIGR01720 family)